jgi:hypothetical protein
MVACKFTGLGINEMNMNFPALRLPDFGHYCFSVMALLVLLLPAGLASATMMSMPENELSDISAQGLFWSDMIKGNELKGFNDYSKDFNFYRVGLDGEMALNVNIGKAQLGCGGVNDFLNANAGCDIDIDYATLMGRSGVDLGNPLSAFILKRPYIEIAVKNDGNPAQREVVGLKIGAQSADGAISAGRRYAAGQTNQENLSESNQYGILKADGSAVTSSASGYDNACSGAAIGGGALGCHSGINSVSGFLGAEMSLSMRVKLKLNIIFDIPVDAWGCIGRTAFTGDDASCGTTRSSSLFVDIAGTRMQSLGLKAAALATEGDGIAALLDVVGLDTLYASLNADLRLVHKLTFENTNDFFISFQREPVAYPRYSKMSPIEEMTANGTLATAFDSCATTNYATARCNSAYSVPANTGWWLNAPSVKLLDVYNDNTDLGTYGLGDVPALLSLFAAPGLLINQGEFDLTPAKNCYGSSKFC